MLRRITHQTSRLTIHFKNELHILRNTIATEHTQEMANALRYTFVQSTGQIVEALIRNESTIKIRKSNTFTIQRYHTAMSLGKKNLHHLHSTKHSYSSTIYLSHCRRRLSPHSILTPNRQPHIVPFNRTTRPEPTQPRLSPHLIRANPG